MTLAEQPKSMEELGRIMIGLYGKEACAEAYQIAADDLEELGRQALLWSDINAEGTLN